MNIEHIERVFEPLVDTYVEAGLDVQVVQLIKAAEAYFFKDWVLQNVVSSYAIEKKYDQAVEFVELIEDEYSKASALSSLAGEYLRNGQKDKAFAKVKVLTQLASQYATSWTTSSTSKQERFYKKLHWQHSNDAIAGCQTSYTTIDL